MPIRSDNWITSLISSTKVIQSFELGKKRGRGWFSIFNAYYGELVDLALMLAALGSMERDR